MAVEDKPSLIILRSHIGWPAPNLTDSEKAHGDPFPPDEIRATKEILGLPPDQDFYVPDEVIAMYRECIGRGQAVRSEWEERMDAWTGDRATWELCLAGRGEAGWQAKLPVWEPGESLATRVAVNRCINASLDLVPSVLAGGADLTGNTGTKLAEGGMQSREDPGGRQLYFGVREHGMGGVMNGMALHGGTLPIGGTFFNFSDYMRGAVRLAALSGAHLIYAWTHD